MIIIELTINHVSLKITIHYIIVKIITDYVIIKQRGANTFVVARTLSITADTLNGDTTISNLSSATGLAVGDMIAGAGIPTDARVASIVDATTITITSAATATATGVTLYYEGVNQVGKLVDTTPNANGEIYMTGSTIGVLNDDTVALVPIAKITRRLAYGFPTVPVLSTTGFNRGEDSNLSTNHDATRYTWYLENDSSADYIVLTAI
jgi:hypothetical protein